MLPAGQASETGPWYGRYGSLLAALAATTLGALAPFSAYDRFVC